jgi:hypothetical protein
MFPLNKTPPSLSPSLSPLSLSSLNTPLSLSLSYYSPASKVRVFGNTTSWVLHASLNSTSAWDILQNTEFNAGGSPHEIFTCLKGYAVPIAAQIFYFNILQLHIFHATNADYTKAGHQVKFYLKR